MKLYRVTVEREMLVLAADEDAARDIALSEERDCDPDAHAVVATCLYGEEHGSLVWHAGEDDITAEDALARSLA